MNDDNVIWDVHRFSLAGGLDTKSDSATTTPEKLQVLQNGEFTKRASVRKRRGYTALSDYTGSAVQSGDTRGIASHRDELLVLTSERVYSHDERTDQLQDRGPFCPVTHKSEDVAQTSKDQTYPAMATVNGVTAYVWQEAANLLKYTVVNTDGTTYVADATLASATCSSPSVVVVGNSLVLLYIDTSSDNLKAKSISSLAVLETLSNPVVTMITDLGDCYAVCSGEGTGYVAWHTDGTGSLTEGVGLAQFTPAGVLGAIVSVSAVTPETVAINYSPYARRICVAWVADPACSVRMYDVSLIQSGGVYDIDDSAGVARCSVAYGSDVSNGNGFVVAFETEGATVDVNTVKIYNFVDDISRVILNAHLVSAGFCLSGRGMFVLGHESRTGLQNSYFLYDSAGNCLGSLANSIASDRPDLWQPPMYSEGMVLNTRRRLDVDRFMAQFGHNTMRRYQFDESAPLSTAEHGYGTYTSGSQLWLYDGVSAVEAGFHLFPDVREGTTSAGISSIRDFTSVPGSYHLYHEVQYNYRFYYEWHTATGERIRSFGMQRSYRPDFGSSPSDRGKISITIPCLTHTMKSSDASFPRGDVSIVVYRSQGDLSQLFFRVTNPDPSVDTGDNCYLRNTGAYVTFVDNMNDLDYAGPGTGLISKEQDLESLLQLKHVSPPAPEVVCTAGTRLYIAGGEVPEGSVYASKERNYGETCQFAGELQVLVSPDAVTELGPLDDAVAVFTRDKVYLISGGLNNNGDGDGFRASLVTTDVGCTDRGSVALVPEGLMFKSAKGIYSFSRGGQVGYIGEFVESFNDQVVKSAKVVPDTNQVIFLCESGLTLMYDYHYDQWGTFTNHLGISSCVVRDTYAYVRTNGTVFLRSSDPEYAKDAGNPYTMKVRTGNYAFEAGQLYWRLRRAGVLGRYRSKHRLRMGVYYNRDTFPASEITWDPTTVIDTSLWGDEALWGTSLVRWGGSVGGSDYQFFRRVRRQKTQQVRFEFEDIISDEAGASYELIELLLEVGILPGPARVSAGRKV